MIFKFYFFRALDFIQGRKASKKDVEVEFGEFTANGKGEVEINLPNLPRVVDVKFKDEEHYTPCDHHHDKLHFEIKRFHHQYELIIKWHVNGLREVSWIAYF